MLDFFSDFGIMNIVLKRGGRAMSIKYPQNVKMIAKVLQKGGFSAYAVGGCIRDSLMGKHPNDWDMTTSARPDQMLEVFENAGFRTIPTGLKHGTVTVLLDGERYECTSFRIDGSYTDSRHPDKVTFTSDVSDDLKRRDFTVNAMAGDPCGDDGDIIDLFGGRADIENRLVRCVGDAETRFCEDALRILRAVRFATVLDFEIESETLKAASKLCHKLQSVSAERRVVELKKILLSPFADRGIELLFGIGAQEHIHRDIKKPCVTLSSLPVDFGCRMAALFGTFGAPELSSLKLSGAEEKQIKALCCPKFYSPDPSEINARRLISNLGDYAEQAALLHGDIMLAELVRRENAKSPCVKIGDLDINGNDLLAHGIAPREIGAAMQRLLDAVISDPSLNQKDILLNLINKKDF